MQLFDELFIIGEPLLSDWIVLHIVSLSTKEPTEVSSFDSIELIYHFIHVVSLVTI